MKPAEELVAAIRELRFAIDRLSQDDLDEDVRPASYQALVAQAKALQGDIDRLLEQLGAVSEAEAFERDFLA